MGTIREDVFLGTVEKYNQKLEMLVKMAQPEKWTYKKIQDIDPYRILRNYIQFTYNRIDEENKFIVSPDGKFRCMNTGLLTVYNQEIVAIFAQNERADKQPWFFSGFFRSVYKELHADHETGAADNTGKDLSTVFAPYHVNHNFIRPSIFGLYLIQRASGFFLKQFKTAICHKLLDVFDTRQIIFRCVKSLPFLNIMTVVTH